MKDNDYAVSIQGDYMIDVEYNEEYSMSNAYEDLEIIEHYGDKSHATED